MQRLEKIDRNLLSHMTAKQAHVISKRQDSRQYIAVPNGDKRRRPVAWINEATLDRLLLVGALIRSGQGYILSNSLAENR